jgi:hypothetical protein
LVSKTNVTTQKRNSFTFLDSPESKVKEQPTEAPALSPYVAT